MHALQALAALPGGMGEPRRISPEELRATGNVPKGVVD